MKLYLPGLVLVAIGIVTSFGSMAYEMGSASRMGPGYYPFLLGVTLGVLGALELVAAGFRQRMLGAADEEPVEWSKVFGKYARPWCAILVGAVLFILIGEYGGLVPATFAMIFVTALGDSETSVAAAAFLAVGVLIFTLLVFHYGMGLQFPLFRWG